MDNLIDEGEEMIAEGEEGEDANAEAERHGENGQANDIMDEGDKQCGCSRRRRGRRQSYGTTQHRPRTEREANT